MACLIVLSGMPLDEAVQAKKAQFQYELCLQHCSYHCTEKCLGIDFCMVREGFL